MGQLPRLEICDLFFYPSYVFGVHLNDVSVNAMRVFVSNHPLCLMAFSRRMLRLVDGDEYRAGVWGT